MRHCWHALADSTVYIEQPLEYLLDRFCPALVRVAAMVGVKLSRSSRSDVASTDHSPQLYLAAAAQYVLDQTDYCVR